VSSHEQTVESNITEQARSTAKSYYHLDKMTLCCIPLDDKGDGQGRLCQDIL